VTQKGHIRTKVKLFKKSYTRIGITNNSIQSNKRTLASQTYNMFDEEEGANNIFRIFYHSFFYLFVNIFLNTRIKTKHLNIIKRRKSLHSTQYTSQSTRCWGKLKGSRN